VGTLPTLKPREVRCPSRRLGFRGSSAEGLPQAVPSCRRSRDDGAISCRARHLTDVVAQDREGHWADGRSTHQRESRRLTACAGSHGPGCVWVASICRDVPQSAVSIVRTAQFLRGSDRASATLNLRVEGSIPSRLTTFPLCLCGCSTSRPSRLHHDVITTSTSRRPA